MRNISFAAVALAAILTASYFLLEAQKPGLDTESAAAASSVGVQSVAAQTVAPARVPETGILAVTEDDRVLGKRDAPVTIIEYASLTCPHCADFHATTLPKLKATYIESGQAKLVYRDFPLDGLALRAAMLARCAPSDRYFPMLDAMFGSQGNWARSSDPLRALAQIARLAGMGDGQIDACLKDEGGLNLILARSMEAESELKVSSTPTLFVNGAKYPGARPFEELETIIKPLLK